MSIASHESAGYWSRLFEQLGTRWNRFWFTPADPAPLSGLRLLAGLLAIYYVASFSTDLTRWFASDGLLTTETVRQLTNPETAEGGAPANFHWSYLHYAQRPVELWIAHLAGLAALVLFTAGLWTRVTSVLALIVVLSYVHRAPMLNGQFEAVLTMLLAYLAIGPSGRLWSVDAWLAGRREAAVGPRAAGGRRPDGDAGSVVANISLRLLQCHVAALYMLMCLTQLGGAYDGENGATWWRGEAVWWLLAKSESRLVDLTFLHTPTGRYVVAAWTHAIVYGELAFALLIWKPLARPLLLVLAAAAWVSLIPVTGLVSYCVAMLVANLAFLDADIWRSWLPARLSGSVR